MGKATDEIGNRYNRLLVTERVDNNISPNGRQAAAWLCKCDCGNTTTATGLNLRRGNHQSCGCLRKERSVETNQLPYREASFNALLKDYKKKAKKRNYEWKLSEKQFRKLTSSKCFYCSTKPYQVYGNGQKYNGLYIYNGIDRLYNSEGYTLENSVACCGSCNMEKGKISPEMVLKLYKIYFKERGL